MNGAIASSAAAAHALGFLDALEAVGPTLPATTSDPALFAKTCQSNHDYTPMLERCNDKDEVPAMTCVPLAGKG